MDREELTPDLDAKEALSAFRGASWTQKPDAHSCLASFSAALQEKGLIGLTSATFSHAHEFIRSAYEKISEKVANQYRNILSSFFRSRGDLKPSETFASVKEIIQEKEPSEKIQRHFAKSETQAKKAVGMIHRAGLTRSVGTENTYRDCLKVFCDFIKQNQLGDLKNAPKDVVNRFLKERSQSVGQKTCDKYKQAIQAFLQARGDLMKSQRLAPVKSQRAQKLTPRAYSAAQVEIVKGAQAEQTRLSTDLAYRCGLRAHELLTIRRISEKEPDKRFHSDGRERNLPTKFKGRGEDSFAYVVTGKGGLTREIRIPKDLAEKLEARRLDSPRRVTDRGIHYVQHYDIVGGKRFTDSFSRASTRSLGWSKGAHGLRHSFAQERMREVAPFCPYGQVKETVSQELGHYRPDITDAYLR